MENDIRRVFSDGGLLSKVFMDIRGRDYDFNPVQLSYALAVVNTIKVGGSRKQTPIGMLQGETGTGKSLGYLIPLMLHSAQTGKRVAVSTYTLQLMDQLWRDEIPVAVEVIKRLTRRILKPARRIGMQNFLSLERIEERLDEEKDATWRRALESMRGIATSNDTDGLVQEWLEQFGDKYRSHPDILPGLYELCVTSLESDSDAKYLKHLKLSHDADMLLTTHATALLHALSWFRVLDDSDDDARETRTLVFDEADRIPDAAAGIFCDKVQIRHCIGLMKRVEKESGVKLSKFIKPCEETMGWFEQQYRKSFGSPAGDTSSHYVHLGRVPSSVRAAALWHARGLRKSLEAAADQCKPRSPLRGDIKQEIASLDRFLASVKNGGGVDDRTVTPTLNWSPRLKYAGFESYPMFPGNLLGRYWARTEHDKTGMLDSVVLTSATLSATAGDPAARFLDLRIELGLARSYKGPIDAPAPFAPHDFGRVSYVLADPRKNSVPKPCKGVIDAEDIAETDHLWIKYAGSMAREAAKHGRTLVLCNSYSDTDAIGELIPGALVHKRGQKLTEIKREFTKRGNTYSALVTPVGWEGLDLKGHIKNLVITRLPYEPLDELRMKCMIDYLATRGIGKEHAEGYARRHYRARAIRKFGQGHGRGIRGKDDKITVWVADPRFALPEYWSEDQRLDADWHHQNHAFLAMIPERFRLGDDSAYAQAKVFLWDGKKGRVIEQEKRAAAPSPKKRISFRRA